jgi:hypothetical protein
VILRCLVRDIIHLKRQGQNNAKAKSEELREKFAPVPLCPLQTKYKDTWD